MLILNSDNLSPQSITDAPSVLKVGAVQLNSGRDVDANLVLIEQAVTSASKQGVQLLVLPENAGVMGDQQALATRYDELVSWYGELTKAHGIFLVAGTLPCSYRPDGSHVPNNKVRQSSLVFAPDGQCVARYDKIHLFKATVADGAGGTLTHYDEGRIFEAGETPVVAELNLSLLAGFSHLKQTIMLGMMICFDLRFPAYAQHLRDLGADILVAPSAFTFKTGQAHWHKLLTSRALDSQCMTIGSAQGGKHVMHDNSIRQTWGHGTIVNANGETVAEHPDSEVGDAGFALMTTDFDIRAQNKWREALPIFACRRSI